MIDEIDYIKSELATIFDEDVVELETENLLSREEYEHIGSTGFAQVGRDDYHEKQEFEKKFLMAHIEEKFGKEPKGSHLHWKAFPHDFGTYHELVFYYTKWTDTVNNWIDKLQGLDWDALEEEVSDFWEIKQNV